MEEDGKAGRLFEWQDGPLVTSMLTGSVLLIDEISLADDSVLERLNSVLEPSRYSIYRTVKEYSAFMFIRFVYIKFVSYVFFYLYVRISIVLL